MSVLMEFAMFPTDKGDSVSAYVSKVIESIDASNHSYQLTAMGTVVEVDTMEEALAILQRAYDVLDPVSERVYSSVKFDIRKNKKNRLKGKIDSIHRHFKNAKT